MKKITQRKLITEMDPAAAGSRAARQDAQAAKNKNIPYSYYWDEFYDSEKIRQSLMSKASKYGSAVGADLKKAAILIEKAQNAMLKSGR